MKRLAIVMMGLLLLSIPRVANVAGVDWLGRISALGGAEGETWRRKEGAMGGSAHGVGLFEGLGVIPITPMVGLQLTGGVGGGDSFRMHFQGGPIVDFGMGKAGVFWGTQFRHYAASPSECCQRRADRNFWGNWIRPAVSLYDLIPGTNLDIWYSQPVGGSGRFFANCADQPTKRLVKVSEGRVAVNWFPAIIWRDNVELTLGVHVTAMSGADSRTRGVPNGVGPVFGAAVMPIQNLEVALFKAQIDNRNRYRVTSGVQWYFNRTPATLLQLRRMYLEPTNLPGTVSSDWRPG